MEGFTEHRILRALADFKRLFLAPVFRAAGLQLALRISEGVRACLLADG